MAPSGEEDFGVLFLCTGNSARSLLAEAALVRRGGGRFRSMSAGSNPTGTPHPRSLETLTRLGIGVQRPVYPSRGTETPLSGGPGEPIPQQTSPAAQAPATPSTAPAAPAVMARTALPNFVGRNGVVNETAPLDWPGRRN